MNVPTIDPRLDIPPSHDKLSFVNGPVFSGVSSVRNTERAGDSQPVAVPYPSNTKLAINLYAKITHKKNRY